MNVSLTRDLVILASGVSAGIHGALAPAHFGDGVAPGLGFVVATALLVVVAVVLTRRPQTDLGPVLALLSLVGLIASYALAVTTGVPLLHPEPEPFDGLGLTTKAIETVGVVAAWSLLRHRHPLASFAAQTKGALTWTPHGPRARSRSS